MKLLLAALQYLTLHAGTMALVEERRDLLASNNLSKAELAEREKRLKDDARKAKAKGAIVGGLPGQVEGPARVLGGRCRDWACQGEGEEQLMDDARKARAKGAIVGGLPGQVEGPARVFYGYHCGWACQRAGERWLKVDARKAIAQGAILSEAPA